MILNSSNLNQIEHEVTILGSGPAGISLALALEKKGINSLILEAGQENFQDKSQENYRAEVLGDKIANPEYSRLRQFGGSSNHWGGACLLLDEDDFFDWPISKGELDNYLNQSVEILDIKNNFNEIKIDSNLYLKNFQHSKVNFSEKYFDHIKNSKKIDIIFDSFFFDLYENEKEKIQKIYFLDSKNKKFENNYKKLVFACGGIENSRLLLLLKQKNKIKNNNLPIGKYWMDHPILSPAEAIINLKKYRNYIKENSLKLIDDYDVSNFDYMNFRYFSKDKKTNLKSSIALIPNISQSKFKQLIKDLACYAPKYINSIISDFKNYCSSHIHFTTEQRPILDNKIKLSNKVFDNHGINSPQLLISYDDELIKNIKDSLINFGNFLVDKNLGRVAINKEEIKKNNIENLNGNHHMGGTRIGYSSKDAVVDKNLKIFDQKNFYVLGSSIFRTGGIANPTLTIVQFSQRLADHLTNIIKNNS